MGEVLGDHPCRIGGEAPHLGAEGLGIDHGQGRPAVEVGEMGDLVAHRPARRGVGLSRSGSLSRGRCGRDPRARRRGRRRPCRSGRRGHGGTVAASPGRRRRTAANVFVHGLRVLDELRIPVVQAPMGGGPSTRRWQQRCRRRVASASSPPATAPPPRPRRGRGGAGGHGAALRRQPLRPRPIGVDRRCSPATSSGCGARRSLPLRESASRGRRRRLGGEARLLVEERPAVASAFGCPDDGVVVRLHDAGIEVWVTVTEPEEASRRTPRAPTRSSSRGRGGRPSGHIHRRRRRRRGRPDHPSAAGHPGHRASADRLGRPLRRRRGRRRARRRRTRRPAGHRLPRHP